MKILHLPDTQGQSLSHNWLYLAPANPSLFPHDEGYRIYWRKHSIGEVRVMERRTIKLENVGDMLAAMICGYNREALLRQLRQEGHSTESDAVFYLFHFQYVRYYEPIRKAMAEALEVNLAKNTNNKPFQYTL